MSSSANTDTFDATSTERWKTARAALSQMGALPGDASTLLMTETRTDELERVRADVLSHGACGGVR